MTRDLIPSLRPAARTLPESKIVTVFSYGRTKQGIIPMWAGEGDLPTPSFISDATSKALANGETFYTYQRGLPELRQSLARYHQRLYGREFSPEQFFIVGGGMQAIQMSMQMIAGDGAEVVVPTPAWPNFRGAIETTGAKCVTVPMSFGAKGWMLDLDAVFRACGAKTKAIVINSPANPTGWTATTDELKALLAFARSKNLWIVADEIYNRFYYDGDVAPSLQTLIEPDDRVLFAQTFSKNWAMTGWRIGWLQAPPALGQVIENLIQYNSSGVAQFMQRGAVAAIEDGEPFVKEMIARARQGREIVSKALAPMNTARFVAPAGAFYAFFGIEGMKDSLKAAIQLVDEANIGLAPGTAFGDGGDDYFRLCFLRNPEQVVEAMKRLTTWLEKR